MTEQAKPDDPASSLPSASASLPDLTRYGAIMIWLGLATFALAKAVIVLMTEIGAANPVEGRNPVSFCNVLFAGNLIAAIALFVFYRRDWTTENFARLSTRDWAGIAVMGVLSGALAPSFAFLALESTTVSNVVFLGRIEPILFMILAAFVLKDRPDGWAILGAVISTLGVAAIIAMIARDMGGFILGRGEIFAILTAVTLAAGTIISKLCLNSIPFGIFAVVRMLIGAAIYFFWAYSWFGPDHFMDIFSPVLWQLTLFYGVVIVAGGQILFLNGIRNARSQDVTLAASFSPLMAVAFAFLLLGEIPGTPVLIGGTIICIGIFTAQFGSWYSRRTKALSKPSDVIEIEGRTAFRGV